LDNPLSLFSICLSPSDGSSLRLTSHARCGEVRMEANLSLIPLAFFFNLSPPFSPPFSRFFRDNPPAAKSLIVLLVWAPPPSMVHPAGWFLSYDGLHTPSEGIPFHPQLLLIPFPYFCRSGKGLVVVRSIRDGPIFFFF